MCRRLAKEEGIFAGASSGTAAYLAFKIAKSLGKDSIAVFIVCDTGERYISKYHNEKWLKDNI